MADHNPQHGRRPHFHRGRRGPDRRGTDRRATQREHTPEPRESSRPEGGVDVEQIMRDIRSRIAQRHGIELSTQQIQELAARRLEAILEPRNVKPQLLEQLRKSTSATELPAPPSIETYEFEETTLYATHRGVLRFFRKLLNPILKLFFNPTPLVQALNTQTRINKELVSREIDREQRQSEWNALHFELLQRMVLESSRTSIEMQALAARIESLSAKVDFNERRVRTLEAPPSGGPRQRQEAPLPVSSAQTADTPAAEGAAPAEGTGEATRRRRRRRRGRRSGAGISEAPPAPGMPPTVEEDTDADEGDEDDTPEVSVDARPIVDAPPVTAIEPAPAVAPIEPATPAVPSPPRDEPMPQDPVDHADPGPVDR